MLIILASQAVRLDVYQDTGFYLPAAAVAAILVIATALPWNEIMHSRLSPWITSLWLTALIVGMTAIALIPQLTPTTAPLFFGIAAISGLLLGRMFHIGITLILLGSLSYVALHFGQVDSVEGVVASLVSVAVVAGATAVVGAEFEREAVRSFKAVDQLDSQRLDFERLYAVSAILAGAESLNEVVPHLVGTICNYLNAQVGVVLLYGADRHRLSVMSPIWVNGYPLEVEDISFDASAPGVVTQVFRSGHARYVSSIDQKTDAHAFLRDLGLTEAMVAPLQVESMNVGVIIVGDPYSGAFSEQQLEQFASLAAPAGLVLSQIGRYEAQAEMTRRLEEVAKMKTDFVSVVSHELRTPLTSIIGSLDTVNRPELSPPQPASRRLISTARRQASRLQRLIEDLLVVSRIDRGAVPVQAEAISVEALFSDIARTVSTLEPTIKVEPADLEVRADPDHIHRVLINLLENASKYAEGSDVELHGWARHDRAVLTVVDHGPGIPESERERVFDRFIQMDQSETRAKGGTGLGLSIVKSLTEVMSGTVRIEETVGGGATFVVELPLARTNVPV